MSEEFMRVYVNEQEFIIMKHITTATDTSPAFQFTTEIDGEERRLSVVLESGVVASLTELQGINAEAELMQVMEIELKAEIQNIVDKSV